MSGMTIQDDVRTVFGDILLSEAVAWGLALFALLVVFAIGARKMYKLLKKVVALVDSLAGLPDHMVEQSEFKKSQEEHNALVEERLSEVQHEVKTNHGSSLKDAVVRTNSEVSRMQTSMEQLPDIKAQVTTLKDILVAHIGGKPDA